VRLSGVVVAAAVVRILLFVNLNRRVLSSFASSHDISVVGANTQIVVEVAHLGLPLILQLRLHRVICFVDVIKKNFISPLEHVLLVLEPAQLTHNCED